MEFAISTTCYQPHNHALLAGGSGTQPTTRLLCWRGSIPWGSASAAFTIALSNPRARGKQPLGRRRFFLVVSFLRQSPAGGGGVTAQLWGRVGSRELASARVGLTGVCALPLSRRTLSIESRPSAAGAWRKKNNRSRRRAVAAWPLSYGVASARAGSRARVGSITHLFARPPARASRPAAHQASHITVLSSKIRLRCRSLLT